MELMKHLLSIIAISSLVTSVLAAENISMTGSSTIAPLAAEIAKRFEKTHPSVKIDVQTGGSSRGVKDTREGLAQIGMVSRKLNDDEKELKFYTIALDGVSMILHKNNPVKLLTSEQIIKIYKGEIKNWKEVGGKDAPITVVNKAEGRSTLELFMHYFKIKNSEIKAAVVIGDNAQGIKTVSGNINSIGYVSIGTAESAILDKTPIKLLPMDGIAATTENVKNGSFPISRPLNLITKTEPTGAIKEYIQFAITKEVNDLILDQYFVPLK
jgi:phosphate transport system substrate-binding protein